VVVNSERSWACSCADRIGLVAVGSQDTGELVHAGKRVGRARVVGADGRAVEDIVRLVGNVSVVTEDESSSNLVTGAGRGVESRVGAGADIGTTEDITSDVGTLRVTSQDELGSRALVGVCGHLINAVLVTLADGSAVVAAFGVVVENVFVIARIETVADGTSKLALTTRVRLVPALGEEDVNVLA